PLPVSLRSDLHHLPGPRPGDWWPAPADLARRRVVGWRAGRGAGRSRPASTRRPHSRPAPRLRKVTVTAIDASEAYGETERKDSNGSPSDSAAVCDAHERPFRGCLLLPSHAASLPPGRARSPTP